MLLTDNNAQSEIWELSGDTWTKHTTTSVTPTGGYQPLAFDSARDRLVSVGGGDLQPTPSGPTQTVNMHQTWEWDGSQWNRLLPPHHPPERVRHLAYDAARQLVVASAECSEELWLWDGSDWREGPKLGVPGICDQALVYDHVHEQVFAFGNDTQRTRLFAVRAEGNKELDSAHHPPVSEHAFAAYDSERERLVVYNWFGADPSEVIHGPGTWEWDGNDWTQPMPDSFPKSARFLIYDEAHKSLELFGGVTPLDRFRINDSGWQQVTGQEVPLARTGHAMFYDTRQKALVVAGGRRPSIRQFELWEKQGSACLKTQLDVGPRVSSYDVATSLVYDEARGVAVFTNSLTERTEADPPVSLGTETTVFAGATRGPSSSVVGRRTTASASKSFCSAKVPSFPPRGTHRPS